MSAPATQILVRVGVKRSLRGSGRPDGSLVLTSTLTGKPMTSGVEREKVDLNKHPVPSLDLSSPRHHLFKTPYPLFSCTLHRLISKDAGVSLYRDCLFGFSLEV